MVGVGGSPFLIVLTLMIGRGPADLLEVLPTQLYWETEKVAISAEAMLGELKEAQAPGDISGLLKDLAAERFKVREAAHRKILAMGPGVIPQLQPLVESGDPEAVARAREIIEVLSARKEHRDVRRLMAIRTLAEMKCRDALPVLRKLTASKELFVADYAGRAVAAVEGGTYVPPPPLSAAQRMKDVWMLPEGCALVAQAVGRPTPGEFELEKLLASAGPMLGGQPPEKIARQAVAGLLPFAYKVGNLRVDSITLGLSGDIGSKSGFVVVIVRGLYDARRAAAALKEAASTNRVRVRTFGKVEMVCADEEVAMGFVANDCFVLVAGPRQETLPLEAVAQALTSGRGTLGNDKEMAALINGVDRSGPVWAAAKMTKVYREATEIFAPFTSATFTTHRQEDRVQLVLSGQGDDAEKVRASLAEIDKGLKQAIAEGRKMVEAAPAGKLALAVLQSVRITQEDARARITATVEADATSGLMLSPLIFLTVGLRVAADTPAPAAVAAPAQPAPAPQKAQAERRRTTATRPASRPARATGR